MIWNQVRKLNARYEERQESLQREYKEALLELQAICKHNNMTKWSYTIDTYGEVACTENGLLIKYQECLDCGIINTKVDDINDYNSEIKFCTE